MASYVFADRRDAGRRLADLLGQVVSSEARPLLLGIPSGGVIVARAVADALGWPLKPLVAVKIARPENPEFALGAVTPDGDPVWNEAFLAEHPLAHAEAARLVEAARQKARQRQGRYGPPPDLAGRLAIVVDDGVATGLTVRAALSAVTAARERIVATPVISEEAYANLQAEARVVSLLRPSFFLAVGAFYADFRPVNDGEVEAALRG